MSLEFISAEQAFKEAERRLDDPALQQRVAEYLGGVWPCGFDTVDRPCAVFAPYLAKGSVVEVDFLQKANGIGFTSVTATYEGTEYVTANPGTVDCYRAPLIEPRGQRSRTWIVPTEERVGAVGEAQTIYPKLDIVEYWRGVRSAVLEQNGLPADDVVTDFGDWYRLQAERFGWQGGRSKSPYYYMALMGLYASGRAVLFDTPPTEFAGRIMKPAADAAQDKLGVRPLVTCELWPDKRDWVDVSFLSPDQLALLKEVGSVQ